MKHNYRVTPWWGEILALLVFRVGVVAAKTNVLWTYNLTFP